IFGIIPEHLDSISKCSCDSSRIGSPLSKSHRKLQNLKWYVPVLGCHACGCGCCEFQVPGNEKPPQGDPHCLKGTCSQCTQCDSRTGFRRHPHTCLEQSLCGNCGEITDNQNDIDGIDDGFFEPDLVGGYKVSEYVVIFEEAFRLVNVPDHGVA